MSARNFTNESQTALVIARKAAALALDYFNNRDELLIESKKSPLDLVSEADRNVEDYIRSALAESFPEDGFLGEESGGDISKSLWIVDPIDGTTNFLKGLPMWGVSIGLVINGAPKIGIIILPALGKEYIAIEGQGSTCNGKAIHVSKNRDIKRALVIFGRSTDLPPDGPLAFATKTMQQDALLYAFGCCVFNMMCVANGSCDSYVEQRVHPWDGAAAALLVREAGGCATFVLTEESIKTGYPIAAASHAEWMPG
ncbi:myo-inositol-1(or 4)-monophosphatase [Loktanella ponticola]|uniref:Inositol-1-monophosphatase n=1 Tax=Yoonia ponticola TaxID=1524255 RepID=A0A7W9EZF2_9RHOB|nr:inositol monophosphatase [Yoonia ponticola]MBB5723669.1 myo-inositol-1(or 4)-monophosphatase [Yoonia ponticola]